MPVSLSLWGSTCKGLVERGHAPNSLSRLLQRLGLGLKRGLPRRVRQIYDVAEEEAALLQHEPLERYLSVLLQGLLVAS